MTGSGDAGADDWPAILAAHDVSERPAPCLVLDGPSFTSRYTSQVVRIGEKGQLESLLTGGCFSRHEPPVQAPNDSSLAAVDGLVQARAARWTQAAPAGQPTALGEHYVQALERGSSFMEDTSLDLGSVNSGGCGGIYTALDLALDSFDQGISRTATVAFAGRCAVTFDTHTDNGAQSWHMDDLFDHLDYLAQGIDSRSLTDRVTVVVFSEMGRHPQLNSQQGKHHWTFTSALLFGAGLQGGQVIGAFDEAAMGRPVDPTSGEISDSGVSLLPAHLGATILALGDVDPGDYTDASPIAALLT